MQSPQPHLPAVSNQVGVKLGMRDFTTARPFSLSPSPSSVPLFREIRSHMYVSDISYIERNCIFYSSYLHDLYLSMQGFLLSGNKNSARDEGCNTFTNGKLLKLDENFCIPVNVVPQWQRSIMTYIFCKCWQKHYVRDDRCYWYSSKRIRRRLTFRKTVTDITR